MNILIIEDEPLARDMLVDFVEKIPSLNLINAFGSGLEALPVMEEKSIDCLFLDINMPGLSGTELIRSLQNPPLFVFITAYPQYAVEGFELEAVDYIVKPISFERFLTAVNKVRNRISTKSKEIPEDKNYLIVKSDKKWHKLNYDEILYFNAIGDYLKIHTIRNTLIISERLKNIEERLPSSQFIRIHKSYIVSIQSIQYVEGNRIFIDDNFLPIGQTHKPTLMNILGM